ncbi:hypothetical protein WISP_31108 [Willisornis vidua]|uniref:Uncharacterized protein n=1 Tax=Willisornis vidua TaxID=1566151 RepID=A0ABQ9DPI4_9PASS|nr:hypothetical protein WISP_31108 [Willisornis vidua]
MNPSKAQMKTGREKLGTQGLNPEASHGGQVEDLMQNQQISFTWISEDRLDDRDYGKGVKLWDVDRPKPWKKPKGCEEPAEDLLQNLGMESTILLLSIKTDVKSSPRAFVTVLLQEGQLNPPVHHCSSSGADIGKVDLEVSF